MVSTPLSLRYYFEPEASLQAQESLGARLRDYIVYRILFFILKHLKRPP